MAGSLFVFLSFTTPDFAISLISAEITLSIHSPYQCPTSFSASNTDLQPTIFFTLPLLSQ